MALEKYTGYYAMQELTIEVKVVNGRLLAAFPGIPPGFEVRLEPVGEHAFRLINGPAHGAVGVFNFDEDGTAINISLGSFELTRTDGPGVDAVQTGQGLLPPEMVLDREKEVAFAALYEKMMAQADGRFLNYTLPYPKHEFLRYMASRGEIIFHGSGNAEIDEFSPVRTSIELRDKTGRGNMQAVYGTHDGLWPMFFAVVDRGKLNGSIRNGVSYYQNDAGEQIAAYQFSINVEDLPNKPWRDGTMYFLPRAMFQRLEMAPGVMSNEWACETAVKPIARLAIKAEDFPFLDRIGGHDDSELLKLGKLRRMIFDKSMGYEPLESGYALKLNWDEELAANIIEFITLLREFMPQAALSLRFTVDEGDVWLDLDGPPAFNQDMKTILANKFDKAET